MTNETIIGNTAMVKYDCYGIAMAWFINGHGVSQAAYEYYRYCPSKFKAVNQINITTDQALILNAMLATGASMSLAIKSLLEHGTPKEIYVAAAIASTNGINYIKRLFPKTNIWLGALDEELTARSFIVPGLGDAGDLAYGIKIQE